MTGSESKRYYSVVEANGRVASLAQLFNVVLQIRAQMRTLYQLLDSQGYLPDLQLSDTKPIELDPDLPGDVSRNLRVFSGMAETVQEHIEQIAATGCVIKDIDGGLVDWPALDRGREIWLCWKYGEAEVGFWHETNTGFASRRPVSELKEQQ